MGRARPGRLISHSFRRPRRLHTSVRPAKPRFRVTIADPSATPGRQTPHIEIRRVIRTKITLCGLGVPSRRVGGVRVQAPFGRSSHRSRQRPSHRSTACRAAAHSRATLPSALFGATPKTPAGRRPRRSARALSPKTGGILLSRHGFDRGIHCPLFAPIGQDHWATFRKHPPGNGVLESGRTRP